MMSYGQYFCRIQYPHGRFFCLVFCCFLFILLALPVTLRLSLFIHYDRRFINRSNLPYTLTPDDLFFDFLFASTSMLFQKGIKTNFENAKGTKMIWAWMRLRPSESFLKPDTFMEKYKHVFKIKSDFVWAKNEEEFLVSMREKFVERREVGNRKFTTVQENLTRASNRYRDTMKIFYGHIESLCCFSLIYTWEWKTNCETAKREHTLCWRNGTEFTEGRKIMINKYTWNGWHYLNMQLFYANVHNNNIKFSLKGCWSCSSVN